MSSQRVAILGASDNPGRYSFLAFNMLRDYGHVPLPVSPKVKQIAGVPVAAKLADLEGPIDTLTMYVGEALSTKMEADILALKPRRVIFNPGSENPELARKLGERGVEVVEGCTLVMLRTNQF